MSLLDLIYPKRCIGCGAWGTYLCPACFSYISFTQKGFCTVCQRLAIGGLTHPKCMTKYEIDGVFASVSYKGIIKRLLYRFKYNPYLSDLQNILHDLFYEGIIQKEMFIRLLTPGTVFTPIPLHKTRMRERGYNQSQVLAEGLVIKFQTEQFIVMDLLTRTKQTRPQFGLSQLARKENMAGAFALRQPADFAQLLKSTPVIFLIDDIVTTGATLREAGQVLKRAGVKKVYGVAFAHGQ